MRNLNRESFFEDLKEKLVEVNEIYMSHNVPSFENYDPLEDDIQDEEVLRATEILKDFNDVVERNI